MKIAILGTRGIPNNYGGFEQFAEYLSVDLVKRGHSVTVYNSYEHKFKNPIYNGVNIIHKFCPESYIGSFAHFIYDWLCSKDTLNKNFDIIYHAGYQSSAPSIFYFSKKSSSIWITNMDGLEWKRDKWSKPIKILTKFMERLAVKYSNYLISDNIGIKKYFNRKYNINSKFLSYGAEIPINISSNHLKDFSLEKFKYFILVARLEPENNIETILDGYSFSYKKNKFIVVGNFNSSYGKYLVKKYKSNNKIIFIGGLYDKPILDSLRKYSLLYFHGHSVGGTNPSLLEAMALGCFIVASDNQFNKSVLNKNGLYFKTSFDVKKIIDTNVETKTSSNRINCINKIKNENNWKKIVDQHELFFNKILLK